MHRILGKSGIGPQSFGVRLPRFLIGKETEISRGADFPGFFAKNRKMKARKLSCIFQIPYENF
jgi:hypothetical protein